jgi:hypothetical protein
MMEKELALTADIIHRKATSLPKKRNDEGIEGGFH